jgi:LysM repeat protein
MHAFFSNRRREKFVVFFIFGILCEFLNLQGAFAQDRQDPQRSMMARFHQLQNQVKNHEAEIRMFEDKFRNQEEILDDLRRQVDEGTRNLQTLMKSQQASLESKWVRQNDVNREITQDLKNYSTEAASILSDYKNRIGELEKIIASQNRNIENLKSGLKVFLDAQIKEIAQNAVIGDLKVYIVKSGDTLEKVARAHKTTISKLKEINQLSKESDQILIGQKLHVPE